MKTIVQSILIKCKLEDVISGEVYKELSKYFTVDESILEEVEELYYDAKNEDEDSPALICIDLGQEEIGTSPSLNIEIE